MTIRATEQDAIEKINQNWVGNEVRLASIRSRAAAQLIDFTILGIIFVLITYLVKGVWLMMPGNHLWIIFDPICGVFLIAIFAYFISMEGLFGFTLGKLLIRIRVVSEKGAKITIMQSVRRNLCRLVDGIAVYIIGIRFARKSMLLQRYGDKFAQTIVIWCGK